MDAPILTKPSLSRDLFNASGAPTMKSHPIRHSPKYFAAFAHAFKPITQLPTKLVRLTQQARLHGMAHQRRANTTVQNSTPELDRWMYMDKSSCSEHISTTVDSGSPDKSPNPTIGNSKSQQKAPKRTPSKNERRLTGKEKLLKEIFEESIDGWSGEKKIVSFSRTCYNDPVEKLKELLVEVQSLENDCYRSIDESDLYKHESEASDVCLDKYSCSDSEDIFQYYYQPTYNIKECIPSIRKDADAFLNATLQIGSAEDKLLARECYEEICDFLDGLPVTLKPDHIYLTHTEDTGSSTSGS